MKKIVSALILLASLSVGILPLAAQTTSLDAQIKAISDLTAQIQKIQDQLRSAQTTQMGNISTLLTTLKQGSQGDNVKVLQALLAADPSVYPEGRITGFFGPATARAVKKFQKQNGLEQVGNVGPKTLERLNTLLATSTPVSLENDEHGEKRVCAIVPPGHLIAPGWLKKNSNVRPVVPECQTLPPGIAKKLGDDGHGTTTPPTTDTTAPIISGLTSSAVGSTTATVSWSTNESASGTLYYGTTTPVNALTATHTTHSTGLNQTFNLSALSASTTYYFIGIATDLLGNTATSTQSSFTTTQ
ncbi:peptidoglycan-binding protein [Candidatus Parcubacteria bacterium]|nr:peptidoglycan-binding protein [Candidatus Parcubacteria bacterium]